MGLCIVACIVAFEVGFGLGVHAERNLAAEEDRGAPRGPRS